MSSIIDRPSLIRSDFAFDDRGNLGPGGIIHAKPGDTLELGFSGVVGTGKVGDLDVAIRGESVKLDGVMDVVHMSGGHMKMGVTELDAVLRAEQIGRSVVDVTVIAPDGTPSGVLAIVVEVA